MDLKQKYQQCCAEASVKCNSAIVRDLPENSSKFFSWDLSGNIVGTRGAVPVLQVVAAAPQLTELNLSNNNLTSPATKEILKYLVKHEGIKKINLAKNDIRLGGPELVELLKRNRNIVEVDITDTYLRPLFVRLIQIQQGKNASSQGGKSSSSTSPNKAARQTRFSFGDNNAETDPEFEAAEEEAFAAFSEDNDKRITFDTGAVAGGGKKVVRRATVSSEVYSENEIDDFTPDVYEKDDKTREWLKNLLERHDFFSHLEDFELFTAVDAMIESSRLKGGSLFQEGDEDGDMFYIIGSGEVSLIKDGEVQKSLKRGDMTQDLMLLYPQSYTETATCEADCTVFALERKVYRLILSKASKKKRAMYEGFLSEVGFLKGLAKQELLQLADALKPATYAPGASLIHYGEQGTTFYIIVEGVVEVFGRNDAGEVIKVCEFTNGDCVGELEFIHDHKCVADVKAKDTVRTAKMNRYHFEMVMGSIKDVLARKASEDTVYEYYRGQLKKMDKDGSGEGNE